MAIQLQNTSNGRDASGSTVASISSNATNLSAGNLLVVIVRNDTTNAPSITLSDTAGNSFPAASITASLGSSDLISLYYVKNTKANASNVVQANFSPSCAYVCVLTLEYSGCDTVSPLDQTASGTVVAPTTASSVTSGTFTTTNANEVIVAAFSVDNLANTFAAGAGYTIQVQDASSFVAAEDQIVSSIQTNITASASNNTTTHWEMVVATFKAPGGATVLPYPPFQLRAA